jgi:hypothetical protein
MKIQLQFTVQQAQRLDEILKQYQEAERVALTQDFYDAEGTVQVEERVKVANATRKAINSVLPTPCLDRSYAGFIPT